MSDTSGKPPPRKIDLGPLTSFGKKMAVEDRRPTAFVLPATAPRGAADPAIVAQTMAVAKTLTDAGRITEAIPHLQRAAQLAPNDWAVQCELGRVLLDSGNPQAAIPPLKAGTRLAPDNAMAQYTLGRAYFAAMQERDALEPLHACVALAPRHFNAHCLIAQIGFSFGNTVPALAAIRAAIPCAPSPAEAAYLRAFEFATIGQLDRAEKSLENALSHGYRPANQAREFLGMVQLQRGKLSEAQANFLAVLKQEPVSGTAAQKYFESRKATDQDEPLLDRIRARADTAPDAHPSRMLLHAVLGKVYNDKRAYAEAQHHYDAANTIRGSLYHLDHSVLDADVARMRAAFPKGSLLEQPAGKANDARPIFIVGTPRSGTTLIEQIISSHPEVAGGGELTYWIEQAPYMRGNPSAHSDPDLAATAAAGYTAELDRISQTARRVTDKNPFNYAYIGPILRAVPNARFIHVRRFPLDACLSMHTTFFVDRMTYYMGNLDDLKAFYAQYQQFTAHWRDVVPASSFMEVDYEAVVDDREAQTRRLIEFCGLDWDPAVLRPEDNTRTISTASLYQARQPVYRGSIDRWRNYASWFEGFDEIVATHKRVTGR